MRKLFLLVSFFLAASAFGAVAPTLLVNPTTLNFGNVDRASGAQANISVTNTSASSISVSVSKSGNIVVSTSPLALSANQQKSVSVSIEAGAGTAGQTLTGSVTFTTGTETVTVPVSAQIVDQFGTTVSPSSLNFGSVQQGQNNTLSVTVNNTSPNSLNYTGVGNPSFYSVAPATIGAGQSGQLNVTFAAGSLAPGSYPGSIDIKATTGGQTNTVETVSASATVAVAAGAIEVDRSAIDFGNVDRSTGASKSFTLKNASSGSLTFSITKTGNYVVSTSPVTLSAGQQKTINVSIEAGVDTGTLNGSVTATAGGQSATVTLTANILDSFATTVTPSSLDFGTIAPGTTKSLNVSIHNTSTGALSYSFVTSPSLYATAPAALSVAAGQTGTAVVTFSPTSSGSFPGTVTIKATSGGSTNTVSTVTLAGSGTAKPDLVVSISNSSVVPATTTKKVTLTLLIKNNGSATAVQNVIQISLDGVNKTTANAPNLPAGQSATVTSTFTVPIATTGTHLINAQVDSTNLVAESNEGNNTGAAKVAF